MKHTAHSICILLFLLCCSGPFRAGAQNLYTLSGVLKDSISLEPVEKGKISVHGRHTFSDSTGRFLLYLPEGTHTLTIACPGYSLSVKKIRVGADTRAEFFLLAASTSFGAYRVKAGNNRRADFIQSSDIGRTNLKASDIRKIPAIGGETDLIKAIQLSPGVKRGSEGSVGMFVRGGGADQNLILLDDAVIYNAGHLLGFFSVFNTHAVKDMSMYRSGFPSRFGGRLSSVLDIRSREGSYTRTGVEGSLSTIAANICLHGPLLKNKASYMVAARRSYIDHAFRLAGKEMPMHFYDLNARLSWKLNRRDQLSFGFYTGRDVLRWNGKISISDSASRYSGLNNLKIKSDSDLGNLAASLRWSHRSADARIVSGLALVHSRFDYSIEGELAGNRVQTRSAIQEIGLKYQLGVKTGKHTLIQTGIQSFYRVFRPDLVYGEGHISDLAQGGGALKKVNIENAAWLQGEMHLSKSIGLNAGIRFSALSIPGAETFMGAEPRIQVSYEVDSFSSLKFGVSRMKQYIHLISGTSIAMPTDLWYPVSSRATPQLSDQISAAYFLSLPKRRMSFSAEVYYKDMQNTPELKEGASLLLSNDYESQISIGRGYAYGLECMLQTRRGRFSGFAAYTLSRSLRVFDSINGGKPFDARYDRRHEVSLVGHFQISKKLSISASWVYAGGIPFTARTAQFLMLTPGQDQISSLPVYGEKNAHRLSAAHRLDLDLAYRLVSRKRYEYEFHISMYNTYNRTQPGWVEFSKDESGQLRMQQKGLFGMIPAFSFHFKFLS